MIWSEYVESESNVHVVYCNIWIERTGLGSAWCSINLSIHHMIKH